MQQSRQTPESKAVGWLERWRRRWSKHGQTPEEASCCAPSFDAGVRPPRKNLAGKWPDSHHSLSLDVVKTVPDIVRASPKDK